MCDDSDIIGDFACYSDNISPIDTTGFGIIPIGIDDFHHAAVQRT